MSRWRLEEITSWNYASLPWIFVELKSADRNYAVSADELLKMNKKLGAIKPEDDDGEN